MRHAAKGEGIGGLGRDALRRLRRGIATDLIRNPLYRQLALRGAPPGLLKARLLALRMGDEARGRKALAGAMQLGGQAIGARSDHLTVWDRVSDLNPAFRALHRFEWLRDLLAVQDPAAMTHAIGLTDAWIERFGEWDDAAWRPEIVSHRILAWLAAGDELFAHETEGDRKRLTSLGRQVRHLERSINALPQGVGQIFAGIALAAAGTCLSGTDRTLDAGLSLLDVQLQRQILIDGGHESRSPEVVAEILADLYALDALLSSSGATTPQNVRRAIDRMTPILRFFTMSDGGLPSFHGGSAGNRATLAAMLNDGEDSPRTFDFAPHSGYHRLAANGCVAIVDTGGPPDPTANALAHASCLAFEFSAPNGRLIVNCGWSLGHNEEDRQAIRATSAHSTVTVAGASSLKLTDKGIKRDLRGAHGLGLIAAKRTEDDLGYWVEGAHEGYREAYGLAHRRTLFLGLRGNELRGEDTLFRPVSDPVTKVSASTPYAIRFHLHPAVTATLARDSRSVLLTLTDGECWRMRTDAGSLAVEESIYLAEPGPAQPSRQIVIHGKTQPNGPLNAPPNRVRWALQRIGHTPAG